MFESNRSPGFTPAAQLCCLSSSLSLQQRWEAAALDATRVTPSPCPAEILWPGPGPDESALGTGGPHQPPALPACWQRGSEGSTARLASGDSLQQPPCRHLIRREGQQPVETRTRCSHGPGPSPCVWEPPRDLELCELIHGSHQFRNSLQQARQELPTPQKWGSMEFIAQSTL